MQTRSRGERPVKYDGKRDVDIMVVTNHISSNDSSDVLDELLNVLLKRTFIKIRCPKGIALEKMIADNIDDSFWIPNLLTL